MKTERTGLVLVLFLLVSALLIMSCTDPSAPSLSSENLLTSFLFPASANEAIEEDVTADIHGTAVTAIVPYGTNLTAMVATFTAPGATVLVDGALQVAGTTPNNFSSPLTYTMEMEDGNVWEFTVIVSKALNSAKEILSFSFAADKNSALSADVSGVISGTDIIAAVPFGTNYTELVADFTYNGVAVSSNGIQISGVEAKDYTDDIVYTVIAEDGSIQDYSVTVLMTVNRSQLMTMIGIGDDVTRLDTSNITDMSDFFSDNVIFNQDISRWDVSSVTDMSQMFFNAGSFNQDIGRWDCGSVIDMSFMFYQAIAFNHDIAGWDVGNVTDMSGMFNSANSFNHDISGWDVSNVLSYANFSLGTCPLLTEYHPDPSWDS